MFHGFGVRRMQAALCAVCAVVALAFSAAAAAPERAEAQLNLNATLNGLLNVNAGLNLPLPGPASSLNDVFTNNPLGVAQALLCPVGQVISDATDPIPGVGPLTDQLKSVLCALSLVGYAYRTTYIPPSGPPQVRYYRAIALVPALLDVNGDLLPDFSGNIVPNLTLNGVTLTIQRTAFISAGAKVKVEAVLLNPSTPGSYLGIGEDGTAAGTANKWTAGVNVFALNSNAVDLGLTIGATSPPSTLAALGEVFSGPNPDAPEKVTRGNLAFAPVPSALTTRVRTSAGREQVTVTTPIASKVTGKVDVIRPGNERNVDVVIDKLPAAIDVVHTTTDGHENTTYTASGPVGKLTGAFHELAGSTILTAAQLDATAVPAKITLDQFDGKTIVDAPNGSFGSVEARYAKGDDVPAPGAGTGPYLAFHRFSTAKLQAGLRLTNLKSVAIDQAGPYAGRLIFSAPLGAVPLSAIDDVKGITLTGGLSNLPVDTEVIIDPDNGSVTFDGHGTGIDQIAVKATKATGTFFSKAKRIDATIDAIPPKSTFNFKQEDGSVKVAATEPPGTISLLASDGSDAPVVDGSYAWFEDTTTAYRAFVRISGLKSIGFSPDPVGGTIDTVSPQILNLHAQKGGITVDGFIDKLPSHVEFNVPGDRVHIENNGAIDHIKLQAKGLPASAKFKNAKVDIFGISPILDVYLGIDPRQPVLAPDALMAKSEPRTVTFRAPCNPNTDPDCEPPCDPQTDPDGCEPPPPPPPPPPPVIPDPEQFGVDAHGAGVELITAHAWVDDADLELHPDLPTNRSALRAFRAPCNPNTDPDCEEPPCNPNTDPDCEPPPPPPPPIVPPPFPVPDTANAILYDGKTGHEDLRARISNLKHAFYTKNAPVTNGGPFGDLNGTDAVDIAFTQPGDITLGIRKQDSIHGTLKIPQVSGRTLPTDYDMTIGTQRVTKMSFRPNTVIPKLEVSLAAGKDEDGGHRKALISATVDNIPKVTDVCIAKDGFPDCAAFMSDTVATGGASNISISPEIDFNLKTDGPPVIDANGDPNPDAMTINGRICLGDIGSNAWVPAACLSDQVAKKYVDITNLKVSNFDVEYRGEGINSKYCGNCGSDDSLATYLNTDGVLVDRLRYVKDGGKGVEFVKTGQPLTADNYFVALNYSATARNVAFEGPYHQTGTLSCPGNTNLFLLDRAADGTVSHADIPGFNDLFEYEFLLDIC